MGDWGEKMKHAVRGAKFLKSSQTGDELWEKEKLCPHKCQNLDFMPVMGQDDAFLHTAECTDLVGHVEHRVASTTLVEDVSDQMFLSVVGGEDADALRRVAQQTHVHEQGYGVLCFCQVLYRNEKKRGSDVIILPWYGH